jgi:thiamine-phosphate pyrophosphorylase
LKKLSRGFYFITDSALSKGGVFEDVAAAIRGGCRIIQYREKSKSIREMVVEAAELKKLCGSKVLFLVNDRVDVALAIDSDGVHLGQGDMPLSAARRLLGKKRIIGVTVHDVEEAVEAEKDGADYLGVSPIFGTCTKKDAGEPCGVGMLSAVRSAVKIPLVAVGGINRRNAAEAVLAGADFLAAVSDVLSSGGVESSVREFEEIISENINRR